MGKKNGAAELQFLTLMRLSHLTCHVIKKDADAGMGTLDLEPWCSGRNQTPLEWHLGHQALAVWLQR